MESLFADEAFDHLGTPSARFHVDREYLLQVVDGILEPVGRPAGRGTRQEAGRQAGRQAAKQ